MAWCEKNYDVFKSTVCCTIFGAFLAFKTIHFVVFYGALMINPFVNIWSRCLLNFLIHIQVLLVAIQFFLPFCDSIVCSIQVSHVAYGFWLCLNCAELFLVWFDVVTSSGFIRYFSSLLALIYICMFVVGSCASRKWLLVFNPMLHTRYVIYSGSLEIWSYHFGTLF